MIYINVLSGAPIQFSSIQENMERPILRGAKVRAGELGTNVLPGRLHVSLGETEEPGLKTSGLSASRT